MEKININSGIKGKNKIKVYGNVKYNCKLRETSECPFASEFNGEYDDYTCPWACNNCTASVLNKDNPAFTYGLPNNPFGLEVVL